MYDLGYDISELATMVGSQLTITKDAWAKCWEGQDLRTKDLIAMSLMQANLTASSSGDTRPHQEPPGPPSGPPPEHHVDAPRPESNPANVKPPEPVPSDENKNIIDKPAGTRTDFFGARRPVIPFDSIKRSPALAASSSTGLPLQKIEPNTCARHPSWSMGREAWDELQARTKAGQQVITTATPAAAPPPPPKTSSPAVEVKEEVKEESSQRIAHKDVVTQSPWAGTQNWTAPDPRTSKTRSPDRARGQYEPAPKRRRRSKSLQRRAKDGAMRSNTSPQDQVEHPQTGTTFVPKVHGFPDPRAEKAENYLGTLQEPSEPTLGNRRRDEEHIQNFKDGKLPSHDPDRISCSVQFWKLWLSEEDQLWTKIFRETRFFLDNEIVGGHVIRSDATLNMKSGGFMLMSSPDAANRMVKWLGTTPFPLPLSGFDHWASARIADRGVCIRHANHNDKDCFKQFWHPRKASLLVETPTILHQIDVGEAFHGVAPGQCIACHQHGHRRNECLVLKAHVAKYHSDYACYHCGAKNHHLSEKCIHHPPNVAGGKMITYATGDRPFQ